MSEQTKVEEAVLDATGAVIIPTDLPAGTVITITITIGDERKVDTEIKPEAIRSRHIGSSGHAPRINEVGL